MHTNNQPNPKRIEYIDLIKCVSIFLVIWGHAITQLMNIDVAENPLYVAIYSFHMPLFMMVSGFFAKSSFSLTIKEILTKKFCQLIIPSLTFGVMWYSLILFFGQQFSIFKFIHHEAASFWFLKALFIAYLIGFFVFKMNKFRWLGIILSCCFLFFIQSFGLSLFKLGSMLPFFFIGIYSKDILQQVDKHKYIIFVVSILAFTLCLSIYSHDYIFAKHFFSVISIASILNYSIYFTTALFGCITTICSCMIWHSYCGGGIFSKMGAQTLGIYLLQKILLEILLPHYLKVDMNIHLYNFVFTPIISIIFLFLCYWITLLIKKNRYTDALLLGNISGVKR